ncbi:MAG: DUF169 domain-containing protein [Peptococcaceae bacterium]|jgi:uncharacterized protein (DUF169 family)|nr:DUF169 domain-containing protein [Peptococcaceae bacterium]
MKEKYARALTKALGLRRQVVGVKFITYQKEFDGLPFIELRGKMSFCAMARKAMAGDSFKANQGNFNCQYSAYALGITRPPDSVTRGDTYAATKLYESKSIALSALRSMRFLDQRIYGVAAGPLASLEECDVVIILGDAYQIMRCMQGYAYKFGAPGSLCSIGNQAMCSDLAAKPFASHDINISFLCKGARLYAKADPGELGIGLPIDMFPAFVDGVVQTVNPVNHRHEKEAILAALDTPDELGIEIDFDADYGKFLREYEEYAAEMASLS